MVHGNLCYDGIHVGNKGACLNFNLFGMFNDKAGTIMPKPSPRRSK
jgi:hypothetical protein